MGKRQPDNVFLPDKWVFPGGRLEAADALIACHGRLNPADEAALMQRIPGAPPSHFAKSLALAAIRELFEETGYALAAAHTGEPDEHHWPGFRERQLQPHLSPLSAFARAITPPGRTRRYDTRFFMADLAEAHHHPEAADQEFADLGWFTIEAALALDLPTITRMLMSDLERTLSAQGATQELSIPFYYEENSVSRRDLIPRGLMAPFP